MGVILRLSLTQTLGTIPSWALKRVRSILATSPFLHASVSDTLAIESPTSQEAAEISAKAACATVCDDNSARGKCHFSHTTIALKIEPNARKEMQWYEFVAGVSAVLFLMVALAVAWVLRQPL